MTILTFILGILVGAVGGAMGMLVLQKRNETPGNPDPARARTESGQAIKPGKPGGVFIFDFSSAAACPAARKLRFRSFEPGRNMPIVPLKDCDRKDKCHCKLREIVEKRRKVRRENVERRQEVRFEPGKPAKAERRINPGRRASDVAWVEHN